MLTDREIFDKVKTHLLQQKVPSMEDGECVYLNPNGLKCAIGCLIPVEYYSKSIEGLTLSDIFSSVLKRPLVDTLKKSGIDSKSFPLLSKLQTIHDNRNPYDWSNYLDQLEIEYFGAKK